MSRLYVDRISPYQSASVTVDGLDTSTLTTKTTFNSYTSSNDSKVTSLINATGSYVATNVANTFTEGPQIASASDGNGYFNSKPLMPTSGFTQKKLWEANNQNLSVNGNGNYNVVQESLTHLNGYGRWYDGSWYQEFYNSGFTDGAEVSLNGGGWRAAVAASGSSNTGELLIQDNYNGNTQFKVDANAIDIGTTATAGITLGASGTGISITSGSVSSSAAISATAFTGDGSGLSGVATLGGNTFTANQIVQTTFPVFQSKGDSSGGQIYAGFQMVDDSSTANSSMAISNFTSLDGSNPVLEIKGPDDTRLLWSSTNFPYLNAPQKIVAEQGLDIQGNVSSSAAISASVISVDTVLNLTTQDPLPSGVVGDLAASGSNLFFHNGTEFKQVSFV